MEKLEMKGTYLIIIKDKYDKPIANIMLNKEQLRVPTNIRYKKRVQLSPVIFSIKPEILVRAKQNKQKMEEKKTY